MKLHYLLLLVLLATFHAVDLAGAKPTFEIRDVDVRESTKGLKEGALRPKKEIKKKQSQFLPHIAMTVRTSQNIAGNTVLARAYFFCREWDGIKGIQIAC